MKRIVFLSLVPFIFSCHSNKKEFDASGSFEADEVVVSSQVNGQLLNFSVNEGDSLAPGQVVGTIDSSSLSLQKAQVNATIHSLSEKTQTVAPQVQLLNNQLAVQQAQLKNLAHEKERIERLVKADAATGKQLDDINSQIEVTKRQMEVTRQQIAVQRSNVATQNRGILSEKAPLEKQVALVEEQLSRARITNPTNGIVLTKYAEQGEVTTAGKPLYKIADLSVMTLRAYVTGSQLSQLRLNQQVNVGIDDGKGGYRMYKGTITSISDKAEFTPKTIQTKEERANLVYAVKIRVPNDGYLKIGMYGEVKFPNPAP
ncbi:HlyD family secretion protein [Flavisolibacter ginsengisoli]|jgi:HlyD family secretion protein|uniref:HlyD family secretion protein n=1 Tax=Flavisolibacter ginsengisoli DSM 18119 TaxID=1121884 RepID=A0A1M4YF66_9BACT|nr:HlyD family efflux transporter periplasmic adaptor subunit [Flavisolibacter ginsengisoli]SHF04405.1 HlyD family secretion protein [Flavisolibacter ginsengisoli DSM 18119]